MKFGNYAMSGRSVTILSGLALGIGCSFGLIRDQYHTHNKSEKLEEIFASTDSIEKEFFLRNHFYDSLKEKSKDLAERTMDTVKYVGRKFENSSIPSYQKKQNQDALKTFFGEKNGKN